MDFTLRPKTCGDEDFLFFLFSTTKPSELQFIPLQDNHREQFLRMQFNAQKQHYKTYYSEASFEIIMVDSRPIGRIYTHRSKREIRLIDISLLPSYRGFGIGSKLIKSLSQEAEITGKALTLHVDKSNPALSLYEKMGFNCRKDDGITLFMKKLPAN